MGKTIFPFTQNIPSEKHVYDKELHYNSFARRPTLWYQQPRVGHPRAPLLNNWITLN